MLLNAIIITTKPIHDVRNIKILVIPWFNLLYVCCVSSSLLILFMFSLVVHFLLCFVLLSFLLLHTLTSSLCDCQPAPHCFHLCFPTSCKYNSCLPLSCTSSSCSVMPSVLPRFFKSLIPFVRLLLFFNPHFSWSVQNCLSSKWGC